MTYSPDVLRYSAFAATPEGGNPAGVVLDGGGLSDERMQEIAAEVGYSETAFVVAQAADAPAPRYRVRYWSPAAEVPFCGHATVATAVALAERDGPSEVVFDTNAGPVTLRSHIVDGDVVVSFTSVEPEVRGLEDDVLDRLLALLGVVRADLDPRYPAAEAFAGNRHPVVALADRELFDQFRFSPAEVAALMREQGWLGTVTVLHVPGDGSDVDARNLFPVGRITEDPATGSAAASVGAYLRDLGYAGRTIRIHQGAHVRRPSLLTVTIPASGGIEVSGGAFRIE